MPNAAMSGRKLQILVTRGSSITRFALQQADGAAYLSERKVSEYLSDTLESLRGLLPLATLLSRLLLYIAPGYAIICKLVPSPMLIDLQIFRENYS